MRHGEDEHYLLISPLSVVCGGNNIATSGRTRRAFAARG